MAINHKPSPTRPKPREFAFLQRPWIRTALVIVIVLGTAGYVSLCAISYLPASVHDSASLERAARLNPWNADVWYGLGVAHFQKGDHAAGIGSMQYAAKLNPGDSRTWLTLADSYAEIDERSLAFEALSNALTAEPTSIETDIHAATLFASLGARDSALQLLGVAAANESGRDEVTLGAMWRLSGDVNEISHKLTATPAVRLRLMNFLCTHAQADLTEQAWEQVGALRQTIAPSAVLPCIDQLIARNNITEASRIWTGIVHDQRGSDRVFNPGFESDILNGGFDWRYRASTEVAAQIDTEVKHSGSRSLAISFAGASTQEAGVREFVAVSPKTHYALSAFLRSEDLESGSGPRLMVRDARTHAVLASTDEVLGTTPWRQETANFQTGAATNAVEIFVGRTPATGGIRGTMWIDDISLVERP